MSTPQPRTISTYDADGIELRYQLVTGDTLLSIHRDTVGPNEPGERFAATFSEATKNGWLRGTSNIGVRIADEHADAYFTQEVDWRDRKPVVYEPREWLS